MKSKLIAGEAAENYGHRAQFFESGSRRAKRTMCDGCKHGKHHLCASEACPCVCNDSDFRWARKNNVQPPTGKEEKVFARVLAIRPELRELFMGAHHA